MQGQIMLIEATSQAQNFPFTVLPQKCSALFPPHWLVVLDKSHSFSVPQFLLLKIGGDCASFGKFLPFITRGIVWRTKFVEKNGNDM